MENVTAKAKMWPHILQQIVPSEPFTNEQKRELTMHQRAISNWTYLGTWLATNNATFKDLGIFLRLELDGKRRDFIINRLVGRISSLLREALNEELKEIIGPE